MADRAGLVGRLVSHTEDGSLPLWASHKSLERVTGWAQSGAPLLVLETRLIPGQYARARDNTYTVWAQVATGQSIGWLPVPIERLRKLDEGDAA